MTDTFEVQVKHWITEALAQRVAEADIRQHLHATYGIAAEVTDSWMLEIRQHPAFRYVQTLQKDIARFEWQFEIYAQLYTVQNPHGEIPRVEALDKETFLNQYYTANRPVVITGLPQQWSLFQRWSFDYFKQQFGHHGVGFKEQHINPATGGATLTTLTATLAELIHRIETDDGTSPRFYLTAYDSRQHHALIQALIQELEGWPDYLEANCAAETTHFWIGPANTLTHLHCDSTNGLLTQIVGRKHVRLVPSFHLPYVYPKDWLGSHINLDDYTLEQFPRFANARVYETILEPGEAILLPIGWWHQVKALDPSISMTFTGFPVNNTYPTLPDI